MFRNSRAVDLFMLLTDPTCVFLDAAIKGWAHTWPRRLSTTRTALPSLR